MRIDVPNLEISTTDGTATINDATIADRPWVEDMIQDAVEYVEQSVAIALAGVEVDLIKRRWLRTFHKMEF